MSVCAPNAPVIENISEISGAVGSVFLSWANSSGAIGYYLYRELNPIYSISGLTFVSYIGQDFYTDNLGVIGTFYYVVVAFGWMGNSSISNCVNIAIYVPGTPTLNIISPNPNYSGDIQLSWDEPPGSMWFYVYRNSYTLDSFSDGLDYIANVTTNNYLDSVSTPGSYTYAIIASSPFGDSALSNNETINYINVSLETIAAPSLNPILNNSSVQGIVSLTWTAQAGANYYYVFRDTLPIISVAGLQYITVAVTNSYNDTITAPGTYYYAIIAVGIYGNSTLSNCVSVTISAPSSNLSAAWTWIILGGICACIRNRLNGLCGTKAKTTKSLIESKITLDNENQKQDKQFKTKFAIKKSTSSGIKCIFNPKTCNGETKVFHLES